ncbi:hypothetical protein [Thalassospira lucentensis]|uniref:hypothetical protein n=1 Tax=Thalassospira lucentensis TaxID=168935 RepID=UPI003AA93895
MLKNIMLVGCITFLSACANTRDPNPVSMKASNDQHLTCSQIVTEYKANTSTAASKISKNQSDDDQDILLGVLVWPGLADFKNADGIEGNALLDRNIYLRELALEKNCDTTSLPIQPSRYT